MIKRGIRLIGIFFLLWAIWKLIELLIEINSSRFLGLISVSTYIFYLLELIVVCGLVVTGYHLLKLNLQGYLMAFIILGMYAIYKGVYFFLMLVLSTTSPGKVSIYLDPFSRSFEISNPIIISLMTGASFLFYVIQIYFLARKDVIMVFQKTKRQR